MGKSYIIEDPGNKTYLIIPAAGLGTRFSSDSPKQYTNLGSSTILEKTMSVLFTTMISQKLLLRLIKMTNILMILKSNMKSNASYWRRNSCESVLAALKTIKDNSVVMVHDAVRPFIKSSEIKTMISSFGAMDEDILILASQYMNL